MGFRLETFSSKMVPISFTFRSIKFVLKDKMLPASSCAPVEVNKNSKIKLSKVTTSSYATSAICQKKIGDFGDNPEQKDRQKSLKWHFYY